MANERGITEALKEAGREPGREIDAGAPSAGDLFAEDLELEDQETARQFGIQVARRGRPKGSRNRTTQDTVRLILASRRDPLLWLADVVNMTPEQVRTAFRFEKGEQAAEFQRRCAAELAGYVHSKAPTAVKLDGQGFVGVQINIGAPGETGPDLVGGRIVEAEAERPPKPIKSDTCEGEGDEVSRPDSLPDHSSD